MDESRIYKIFGRRVAARRQKIEITQKELGARVLLSRASIANIERGHHKISLHIVYRIAAALGLRDTWDLLPHFGAPLDAGDEAQAVNIVGTRDLSEAERRQVERLYLDTPSASP